MLPPTPVHVTENNANLLQMSSASIFANMHACLQIYLQTCWLCVKIMNMTRIMAISLSKGGVGKTTTAVNLAAGLALSGRQVLLIDTDTQGQVSKSLGVSPQHGLVDLFDGVDIANCLFEARNNLHILAGGSDLAQLERLIARKDYKPESTLADMLSPLGGYFHYIILDTAPSWGPLAVNVLVYARELLCPIQLQPLAVDGLSNFIERTRPIFEREGGQVQYVVPTMADQRVNQTDEILGELRDVFGDLLCSPIRSNIRLSEAPAHGQTIFEYAPNSRGATDYQQLTDRVIKDEQ